MCAVTADADHKKTVLSLGIPTDNRPVGLRRTLECITGQIYKNLEIVVSNNCSPGMDTEPVVRDFMARDNRIRYYKQDINNGLTINFQFVIDKAIGEYFMRTDSYDMSKSQYQNFSTVFRGSLCH